jgi:hypothetical protein
MQHTLVAQTRRLVWFHVDNVPRSVIVAFLEWCKKTDVLPVGRGRASHGTLSLYFDATDAYRVTAWLEQKGITIHSYAHDSDSTR